MISQGRINSHERRRDLENTRKMKGINDPRRDRSR
jgi:hypothetical protein